MSLTVIEINNETSSIHVGLQWEMFLWLVSQTCRDSGNERRTLYVEGQLLELQLDIKIIEKLSN